MSRSSGSHSAKVRFVHPSDAPDWWPKVEHWLRAAMERGDLGRLDELEADVKRGAAHLWIVLVNGQPHAAGITQIVLTEKSKVCMIQACGGSGVNNWVSVLPEIESYARACRCDCVRLMGRKGWQKFLTGYTTTKVVMERRL